MEGDSEGLSEPVEESFVDNVSLSLCEWVNIAVKQSEKRSTTVLKITDNYVMYEIVSTLKDDFQTPTSETNSLCRQLLKENKSCTWRRYSEFNLLRDYLIVTYPTEIVPPLPDKRISLTWQKIATDKLDPEFIERRRAALETFLKRLSARKSLSADPVLLDFLGENSNWRESVLETNFQSKADSKIKSLSASYRITHKNERFEALKNYCSKLEQHTANVLKSRSRAVDNVYGVYKIHSNYGRILSEWCTFEADSMAESLQKAGHFIDAFSSSIEPVLECEDEFYDQLKEYYGFGDALRNVCRKQELQVLEIEQLDSALRQKQTERENLDKGKTGLFGGIKARVFGKVSEEEKASKLKVLDEQILEGEEAVRTRKSDLDKFIDETLENVEQFHIEKVKDIKEILLNYTLAQINLCKQDRAKWQGVKDSFDSV